jgi:hypothetical protein
LTPKVNFDIAFMHKPIVKLVNESLAAVWRNVMVEKQRCQDCHWKLPTSIDSWEVVNNSSSSATGNFSRAFE